MMRPPIPADIPKSQWTLETLRTDILMRHDLDMQHWADLFAAHDRRYEERFIAQEKAIKMAADAVEKRLEGLNELRSLVTEQRTSFMQRAEATALLNAISDRLIQTQKSLEEKIEAQRAEWDRRHEQLVAEVSKQRDAINAVVGAQNGAKNTVNFMYLGLGALLGILGLLSRFIK